MKLPFGLNKERPWVVQRRDGIAVHGAGRRPARWIVARSLCQFLSLDLTQVPTRDRADALLLKLSQWSPIADFEHWVAWQDGRALAWVWPRDVVAAAQAEAGLPIHETLPETVLRAPCKVEGARLAAMVEGYEGQIWNAAGELVHTRWWPAPPDRPAWHRFLRGAGFSPDGQLAAPVDCRLEATPWASAAQRSARSMQRLEGRAVLVGAVFLGLAAAWLLGDVFGKYRRIQQVEASTAVIEDQSSEILDARARAFGALEDARFYAELVPQVGQLRMMADFTRALGSGHQFLRWQFQDAEVRITIRSERADPTFFVRALEALDYVGTVQVQRARDPRELEVRVEVRGA